MKKGKKVLFGALTATVAAACMLSAVACGNSKPKPLTDEPLQAQKIADYTKTAADRAETFASGSKGFSWENGEPFNVWWKPQNVSYEGGKLSLSLSEMTEQQQKWDEELQQNVDTLAKYYGAEERSEHYYGYGDFQVRMKPAKIVGTASTFFTCTGDYDKWYNEDGTEVIKTNKHDEVDIEFLGKDTTKVQFNYFANDQGGHEYLYDLGFDASLEFHDYGFRWTENYITWFVDNVPVYRVDRVEGEAWPEDPGRIIMNYWCGTQKASAWMGEFAGDYSGKAEYEYVATSATQCPDPNTAHVKPPVEGDDPVELDVPTEGWVDIATDGFDGWGEYTVDKTNGVNISHSAAKAEWKCCGMDLASSYSWIKFTVKNNADVAANVRLHIDIKGKLNTSAVDAISPASQKVSVSDDSAALIHLDAKEELEIVLKIKDTYTNEFAVFFNSTGALADREATGDITISGLKGIVNDDVTPPPPAEEKPVKIGTNEVVFAGDYTVAVNDDKTAMTVEYADVLGKSYKNISTSIADFLGDNNTFTVTIKNEGAATAKIRIDIVCAVENGSAKTEGGASDLKNDFCNIKAEYTGTTAGSGNDYDWGGADWVQIAAGETVTVKITFTANVATGVRFFIDSSTHNDDGTHSGKVIFSGMALSKADGEENTNPPQPSGDNCTLSFSSTDEYTVTPSGTEAEEITVVYTDLKGGNYNNIAADAATLAAEKDTFSLKIKNNGETAVKVRVDLIGENSVSTGDDSSTDVCNITATASKEVGIYTDTTYGGTTFTVAADDEVTVIITYSNDSDKGAVQRVQIYCDSSTYQDTETYSGNVTFGEFNFSKAGATENEGPDEGTENETPENEGGED